eukprot:8922734-Pyramimonas_sp.AAC.1
MYNLLPESIAGAPDVKKFQRLLSELLCCAGGKGREERGKGGRRAQADAHGERAARAPCAPRRRPEETEKGGGEEEELRERAKTKGRYKKRRRKHTLFVAISKKPPGLNTKAIRPPGARSESGAL